MPISITGRVVKTKLNSELRQPTDDNTWKAKALRSNHLRVQFADGSQRHMLFTNAQAVRAFDRAKTYKGEMPKVTWIREVWFEGSIDTKIDEIDEIIAHNGLPFLASKINHIRINYRGEDVHLLFTDNEIRKALDRAKSFNKVLPKVSWLTEEFIGKGQINGTGIAETEGETEQDSEPDSEPSQAAANEQSCEERSEVE
ncbi:MAG: hypothetical protein HC888_00275 [Candidatus Competibacteraceae bacterium]|nr:hypothetical protein [Candidatus Competibacteraceae bacterium]